MDPGSLKPPVQYGAQQSCSVPSLRPHPHTGNQCGCSALLLAIRRIFGEDRGLFLPMLPGYRCLHPKPSRPARAALYLVSLLPGRR